MVAKIPFARRRRRDDDDDFIKNVTGFGCFVDETILAGKRRIFFCTFCGKRK